jgi:peptidoglycan/LPS O-acetylase OafA/YrhL
MEPHGVPLRLALAIPVHAEPRQSSGWLAAPNRSYSAVRLARHCPRTITRLLDGSAMQQLAPQRVVGLDLLRFLSLLLVLGRHFSTTPPSGVVGFTHEPSGLLATIVNTWRCGGWVGVDIFFVLSGYLVTRLLASEYARTGTVDTKRFLWRRGWKIYQPLWGLIMFTLAFNLARSTPPSLATTACATSAEFFSCKTTSQDCGRTLGL